MVRIVRMIAPNASISQDNSLPDNLGTLRYGTVCSPQNRKTPHRTTSIVCARSTNLKYQSTLAYHNRLDTRKQRARHSIRRCGSAHCWQLAGSVHRTTTGTSHSRNLQRCIWTWIDGKIRSPASQTIPTCIASAQPRTGVWKHVFCEGSVRLPFRW